MKNNFNTVLKKLTKTAKSNRILKILCKLTIKKQKKLLTLSTELSTLKCLKQAFFTQFSTLSTSYQQVFAVFKEVCYMFVNRF